LETIIIEETIDAPAIVLDAERGLMNISGASYPNNALLVYNPIYKWVEQCATQKLDSLKCEFYYSYVNSASKKAIYELMLQMDRLLENSSTKVIVRWFYDKYDEDMLEIGKEFAEMVKLPFEFIEKLG